MNNLRAVDGTFASHPIRFRDIIKHCGYCGVVLTLRNNRDIDRRNYCSHHCRAKGAARTEAFRANEIKDCGICDAAFTATTFNQKYCSNKCTSMAAERMYRERNATPKGFFKRLIRTNNKRQGLQWEFLMHLYQKQGGRCALSGAMMTTIANKGHILTNVSIDRINSLKGYTEDNVQLVCIIVNMMKHNMTRDQLVKWCTKIVQHNGEKHAFGFRKTT